MPPKKRAVPHMSRRLLRGAGRIRGNTHLALPLARAPPSLRPAAPAPLPLAAPPGSSMIVCLLLLSMVVREVLMCKVRQHG